jgi:hypothetical protein
MTTLWPRLSRGRAARLLASLSTMSTQEARVAARTSHPAAVAARWAEPATESQIAELQRSLRSVADERGWPRRVDDDVAAATDRAWGQVLVERLDLPPSDADEAVWAFLAVVVVPDLVKWRFPGAGADRFLDAEHHALGRLWVRDRVLGRELVDGDGYVPLDEDELVALFRRRELVANPRVARAIVRGVLRGVEPGPRRLAQVKTLAIDLLRTMPALCVDVLDDDELDQLVGASLSGRSVLAGR